jgi:hypothetical protein
MATTDRRGLNVDAGELGSTTQYVTTSSDTISVGTDLLVINRAAPTATALAMPDASERGGNVLRIVDMSTSIDQDHVITLTPANADQKIMRQATYTLQSNSAALAGVTFRPVLDPDDDGNYVWVYAP